MNINESLPYKGDILVVDDTPANLTLLTQMLSEQGYKVRVAPIGKMVLRSVQSNPPALILLDIQMPGMDGYQVCEQLKLDPDACDIPVIFISALDEAIDKVKAFKVGGVDYITKPFQSVEVLARVENQLRIRSLQLELIKQNTQLEQEIQRRTETEEILYQSRALLSSVLNSSLDGIVAMQSVRTAFGNIEDFQCLVINPVGAKTFVCKKEDFVGKMLFKSLLTIINPDLFDLLVQVVETGKSLDDEICYRRCHEVIWYHCIAVKLGDGLAVTFRDITKRKQAELILYDSNKKLQAMAHLDSLTNVANRRWFDYHLEQEWLRCNRQQMPLSLILGDVDYFKLYNDRYGHQAGDICLVQVAKTISKAAKRPGDLVARYGGEEFAVILPNTNKEEVVKVAEKIHLEVKNLKIAHEVSTVSKYVTISLGVVTLFPPQKMSIHDIIASADQALYGAKAQGRDRSIFVSFGNNNLS